MSQTLMHYLQVLKECGEWKDKQGTRHVSCMSCFELCGQCWYVLWAHGQAAIRCDFQNLLEHVNGTASGQAGREGLDGGLASEEDDSVASLYGVHREAAGSRWTMPVVMPVRLGIRGIRHATRRT